MYACRKTIETITIFILIQKDYQQNEQHLIVKLLHIFVSFSY